MNIFIPEEGDEVMVLFKNNNTIVKGIARKPKKETKILILDGVQIYPAGQRHSIDLLREVSNFEIEFAEILAIGFV